MGLNRRKIRQGQGRKEQSSRVKREKWTAGTWQAHDHAGREGRPRNIGKSLKCQTEGDKKEKQEALTTDWDIQYAEQRRLLPRASRYSTGSRDPNETPRPAGDRAMLTNPPLPCKKPPP